MFTKIYSLIVSWWKSMQWKPYFTYEWK
jgi:hypothetical protein